MEQINFAFFLEIKKKNGLLKKKKNYAKIIINAKKRNRALRYIWSGTKVLKIKFITEKWKSFITTNKGRHMMVVPFSLLLLSKAIIKKYYLFIHIYASLTENRLLQNKCSKGGSNKIRVLSENRKTGFADLFMGEATGFFVEYWAS